MAYNSPTALTSTDQFASEEYIKLRDSILFNTFGQFELGGSRSIALPTGGGYKDAIEFRDFLIPDALYTGATYEVIVELRVENAAISITPKIRNLTGGSDTVVGSATTSTTGGVAGDIWPSQTLAITPAANTRYRLMFVKSADTYAAWGIGVLRRKGT